MLLEQLHTQQEVEKYFNTPSRIDHSFADPFFLNQIVSSKQMAFFFEIAHRNNMGNIIIKPVEWMTILDTSSDIISKYADYFVDIGILTRTKKYHYYFNFFKDDDSTSFKGYIHTFDFLYSEDFRSLPLNAQRIAIYLLGKLSKRNPYKKESVIMLRDWYGKSDSRRLFPVWSRDQIIEELTLLTPFFDIELPGTIRRHRLILKNLHTDVKNTKKESLGQVEWMARFLFDHGIESWHPANLRDMTWMFQSLVRHMTPTLAIDLFSNALIKLNLDASYQSDAQHFIDLFHAKPKNENAPKESLMLFKDTFLKAALIEEGEKISKKYALISSEKERIDGDFPMSSDDISSEQLSKLIHFEYDAIQEKCESFEYGVMQLFVDKDREQLLSMKTEYVPIFMTESIQYIQELATLPFFKKIAFASDAISIAIEDKFRKEVLHEKKSRPPFNWLEGYVLLE